MGGYLKDSKLCSIAFKSVEIIKNDNIPPTPCNYKKIFILQAKNTGMLPQEILTYLCDSRDSLNAEEEIRAINEEVYNTIKKVENTVDYLDENISNLLENYNEVDLGKSEENLNENLLKLKQENILMQSKIQSVYQDIKEQKNTIEKIQNLLNQDILMGIYSRRYMESKLKDLMYEYKRYGHTFSILMIDVDNFKNVNDTYGHLVGDNVLMKIGEILKTSLRQTDIPVRYGGDEVLVLLPNTTLIYAEKAALKIQSIFRKIVFKKSYSEFSITVSIGIYEIQPDDTLESVLQKADSALYKAKQDGKNKIIVFKEQLNQQLKI